MQQAFKKALSHNSKSRNSPTTCSYYDQLDHILKGYPSVKWQHITQSLSQKTSVAEVGEVCEQAAGYSSAATSKLLPLNPHQIPLVHAHVLLPLPHQLYCGSAGRSWGVQCMIYVCSTWVVTSAMQKHV